MDKSGKISLSGWIAGQAQSPYGGFGSIVGCEVFDIPGVLKIGNRTVKNTLIATITGLPIKKITDHLGSSWILTQDGKLYKDNVVIKTGISNPWDIVEYQNYILVRYGTGNGVLSAYGPLTSGSQAWTPNFVTGMDYSYYGKLLVGTVEDVNGAVYIGNGQNVATLKQVAGKVFDPTDSSTFAFNAAAYTINNGYCVTFAELGDLLAIGTQEGSNWYDRINFKSADIHYWDRSAVKADSIVHLVECGIQALISKGNRVYAVAGTRGNIYETDGTTYTLIKTIPWNNNRVYNTAMMMYPNAITFNQRGNLIVGTSSSTDGYGAVPSNSKHGVYEIAFSKGYPAVLKNILSTGNVGATQPMYIGMLWAGASDSISIGWQDGAAYGIDDTDFKLYTSYSAYIESQVFYLAPRNARLTIQHIEFKLGKPLVSGQGMKLYGRKYLNAAYKLLGTFDFTNLGAVISHHGSSKFADLEIAQFMLQLTQDTTVPVGNNLELLNFNLW